MGNEDKAKQSAEAADEPELLRRRDFLKSLKKWSQVVIGGIVLGAIAPTQSEAGWINRRGGGGVGWINGGGWINRRGGGGWLNAR